MNPMKEFVKQQITVFTYDLKASVYLIHDRTGEFLLNYEDYGIKGVKTSVRAPKMKA